MQKVNFLAKLGKLSKLISEKLLLPITIHSATTNQHLQHLFDDVI